MQNDKSKGILVVDDSEESLRVLVSIIEEQGFEARPVTTGSLALKSARLFAPDLIMLDIGLPDMDGYEVCAELKSEERTRDIPILFISGLHATEDKVRALASGGVDYITKPFQIDEIKARIKTHLALRDMQKELLLQNVRLQQEIAQRKRAQQELVLAHDALEQKVLDRTAELSEVNKTLRLEIEKGERTQKELISALDEINRLKYRLQRENTYLRKEVEQRRGNFRILGESEKVEKLYSLIKQVASTDTTVLILGETGTGKELVAQIVHENSPRRNRAMVTVNCAALPSGIVESELFGRAKGAYTGAATDQSGRFEVADGSTIFLDEIGELPAELQAKLLRVLQDGSFEKLGSSKTIRVDVRVIAATNKDLETAVSEGRFRRDLYYRLNVFPIVVPPLRERAQDIPALTDEFVSEFAGRMGKPVRKPNPETLDALQRYSWPGNVRELRNIIERAMILSDGTNLDVHLPDAPSCTYNDDVELEDMERRHILRVLDNTGWKVKGKNGAAEKLGLKPTTLQSKMKKLGIARKDS